MLLAWRRLLFARKQRMYHLSRVFPVSIATLAGVILAIFSSAAPAAEEAKKSTGPVLVAELPPKPETKKYDLRYKFSRGDVLRYDVTHEASVRGTSEQTTQAAQTKTDSVKAWKVTD